MTPETVRSELVDALRLDLIGPGEVLGDPGRTPGDAAEVLPQRPSSWYLTGFLVPVGDATDADLREARVRLARHLVANGLPGPIPPLEEPLPDALMEELRAILLEAEQGLGTPAPGDVPLVVRRASDDVTPAIRVNGREVARSLGPFADGPGRRYWFEVFERFHQLAAGRAALLISHRLSTVRMADRIYVLDRGRIIEVGDHESLVERGGTYAHLFETQARYYQ